MQLSSVEDVVELDVVAVVIVTEDCVAVVIVCVAIVIDEIVVAVVVAVASHKPQLMGHIEDIKMSLHSSSGSSINSQTGEFSHVIAAICGNKHNSNVSPRARFISCRLIFHFILGQFRFLCTGKHSKKTLK